MNLQFWQKRTTVYYLPGAYLVFAILAGVFLLVTSFYPEGEMFRVVSETLRTQPWRALLLVLLFPGLLFLDIALVAAVLFFGRTLLFHIPAFFRREIAVPAFAGAMAIFSLTSGFAYYAIQKSPGLFLQWAKAEGDFHRLLLTGNPGHAGRGKSSLLFLNDLTGNIAQIPPGSLKKISGRCRRIDRLESDGYRSVFEFHIEFHIEFMTPKEGQKEPALKTTDAEHTPAANPQYRAYRTLLRLAEKLEPAPYLELYDCPTLESYPPGSAPGRALHSNRIYFSGKVKSAANDKQ